MRIKNWVYPEIVQLDSVFYAICLNTETKESIILTHRGMYMFYEQEEIDEIVENLFNKLLSDDFCSFFERQKFIKDHDFEWEYL